MAVTKIWNFDDGTIPSEWTVEKIKDNSANTNNGSPNTNLATISTLDGWGLVSGSLGTDSNGNEILPSARGNYSICSMNRQANKPSGSTSVDYFNHTYADLKLTVTLPNSGTLKFQYTGYSEEGDVTDYLYNGYANYDYLMVLVDGDDEKNADYRKFTTKGTEESSNEHHTQWVEKTLELSAGTHQIIFRYRKDPSGNKGVDRYCIDDITFDETLSSSSYIAKCADNGFSCKLVTEENYHGSLLEADEKCESGASKIALCNLTLGRSSAPDPSNETNGGYYDIDNISCSSDCSSLTKSGDACGFCGDGIFQSVEACEFNSEGAITFGSMTPEEICEENSNKLWREEKLGKNYGDHTNDGGCDDDSKEIRKGTINKWIVPATGVYEITAYGASGGDGYYNLNLVQSGCKGAIASAQFSLTKGWMLKILAGKPGGSHPTDSRYVAGGGGGGSFVVLCTDGNTCANPIPLVIAGGGGGGSAYSTTQSCTPGQAGENGGRPAYINNGNPTPCVNDYCGAGGTGGADGSAATGNSDTVDDGSDTAADPDSHAHPGMGWNNHIAAFQGTPKELWGTTGWGHKNNVDGGWGGGGGGYYYNKWYAWAGGGGGYSGGGSGHSNKTSYSSKVGYGGGGGGSYVDSTYRYDTASNPVTAGGAPYGRGKVTIKMLQYPNCKSDCKSDGTYRKCPCFDGDDVDSLVYLKFNEGGSATTTKNYGSLSGNYNVAGGAWTTNGKSGNAYNFSNSNANGNRVTTTSLNNDQYKNNFTVMAWVKTEDSIVFPTTYQWANYTSTVKRFVFGANYNYGAEVSVGTNGVALFIRKEGNSPYTNSSAYVAKNTTTLGTGWNHIAVVYEAKNPTIYVNGSAANSAKGSSNYPDNVYPPNMIGGRYTATSNEEIGGTYVSVNQGLFNGLIDEAKIFDRALSAGEIAQQFNALDSCSSSRFRKCVIPENAVLWRPESDSVEQTLEGDEWKPDNERVYSATDTGTPCAFKCLTGTYNEDTGTCGTTQDAACTGLPASHAHWVKTGTTSQTVQQTWNGSLGWIPKAAGEYKENPSTVGCYFVCDSGYTYNEADNTCIQERTAACTGYIPANATWLNATITQNWNGSAWTPSTTESTCVVKNGQDYVTLDDITVSDTNACYFKCNENFSPVLGSDGKVICDPDRKDFACTGLPDNAVWVTKENGAEVEKTSLTTTHEWKCINNSCNWSGPTTTGSFNNAVANYCYYKCKTDYHCTSDAKCEYKERLNRDCSSISGKQGVEWNTAGTTDPRQVTQKWTSPSGIDDRWQYNGDHWSSLDTTHSETDEADKCYFKCSRAADDFISESAGCHICGDGSKEDAHEACDSGADNGKYNECNTTCTKVLECGDNIVQNANCNDISDCTTLAGADELCDRGSSNSNTWKPSEAERNCGTDCKWAPYCGDGEEYLDKEFCDFNKDYASLTGAQTLCSRKLGERTYYNPGEGNYPTCEGGCAEANINAAERVNCLYCGDGEIQRNDCEDYANCKTVADKTVPANEECEAGMTTAQICAGSKAYDNSSATTRTWTFETSTSPYGRPAEITEEANAYYKVTYYNEAANCANLSEYYFDFMNGWSQARRCLTPPSEYKGKGWERTSEGGHNTYCSVTAGKNYTMAELKLKITAATSGSISFSYYGGSEAGYKGNKVHCEGGYEDNVFNDGMLVYFDKTPTTGENGGRNADLMLVGDCDSWRTFSKTVDAGEHTIIFRYFKDSGTAQNIDKFCIDNISFNGIVERKADNPSNAVCSTNDTCKIATGACYGKWCGDNDFQTEYETCEIVDGAIHYLGNDGNDAVIDESAQHCFAKKREEEVTANVYTGTIEDWIVPKTGLYEIEAHGASGGDAIKGGTTTYSGCVGAKVKAQYALKAGQKLRLLAGKRGAQGSVGGGTNKGGAGGGGGSFVVLCDDTADCSNPQPLVIAGGGGAGGNYDSTPDSCKGQAENNGGGNGVLAGGQNGANGANDGTNTPNTTGGKGWTDMKEAFKGETAHTTEAEGQQKSQYNPTGGFGGGGYGSSGSAGSNVGGGGGGGYSGGSAGRATDNSSGGGGSYISEDSAYYYGGKSGTTGGATGTDGKGKIVIRFVGYPDCESSCNWKGSFAACDSSNTATCEGNRPVGSSWWHETVAQTWQNEQWLPVTTWEADATAEHYSLTTPTEDGCFFKCDDQNGKKYTYESDVDPNNCIHEKTINCPEQPANSDWWNGETYQGSWNGSAWSTVSLSYSPTNTGAECSYHCKDENETYGYKWNGSACVAKTQTANCSDLSASFANAEWIKGTFTQTWNGSAWDPATKSATVETHDSTVECSFKCIDEDENYGYKWENNQCVAKTQSANCTGLPNTANSHAKWVGNSSITQTWDGSNWGPSPAGIWGGSAVNNTCIYQCAEGYHRVGETCVSNSKSGTCNTLTVSNAEWNTANTTNPGTVTQSWAVQSGDRYTDQGTTDHWSSLTPGHNAGTPAADNCWFKCIDETRADGGYKWNGSACVAKTQTANCTGKPGNSEWVGSSSINQTWNGNAWEPAMSVGWNGSSTTANCTYQCAEGYHRVGNACVSNSKDGTCISFNVANAQWNTTSNSSAVTRTWAVQTGDRYTDQGSADHWSSLTTVHNADTPAKDNCWFKCKDETADDKGYEWKNNQCVAKTQTANCTGLPNTANSHAVWVGNSSITQTWEKDNANEWGPSNAGTWGGSAVNNTCIYQCAEGYHRVGETCVSNTNTESCEDLNWGSPTWNLTGNYTVDPNNDKKATVTQTWTPQTGDRWNDQGVANHWTPSSLNTATSYSTTAVAGECHFKCGGGYSATNKSGKIGCQYCGDGEINGNETCDGEKDVDCSTLGDFNTGTGDCKADCSGYDTSGCSKESGGIC